MSVIIFMFNIIVYKLLYTIFIAIDYRWYRYIIYIQYIMWLLAAIFVFFAGYSFIWQTFNLYHSHSTKCRCRSDAALDPQEKNGVSGVGTRW